MHTLEFLPSFPGAIAAIPAFLLLFVIAASDRSPEPAGVVWVTFALGIASVLLLPYARLPFAPWQALGEDPWSRLAARSLFGVAVPEESVKIAIIALMVWLRRSDDAMDGVVIGAAAGLGFAAHENLNYFSNRPDEWQMLAISRNVLTVPFHAALGIMAGAYFQFARIRQTPAGSPLKTTWLVLLGCTLPIAWHALYDFSFLTLRYGLVRPHHHAWAESAGILLGIGAIAYALGLILRVHAGQRLISRRSYGDWRCVTVFLTAAAGGGLFGAGLIAASLHLWLRAGQPLPFDSLGVGVALLGYAIFWCHHANLRLHRNTDAGARVAV